MILTTLTTLGHATGLSAAAASRPALTFFLVQIGVGIGTRLGWAELPSFLSWTVSFVALAFGGAFAVLELVATHQADVAEFLDDLYLQRIAAGLSAFTTALLLVALGAATDDMVPHTPALQPGAPEAELVDSLQIAAASGAPVWLQVLAVSVAVAVNLGLGWLRARVLEALRAFGFEGWWAWVETGGVLGLIAIAPLLPLLVGLLVVVAALAVGLGLLAIRGVEAAVDRRHRVPCPVCEHRVREEASRCPACRAALEPTVWLEPSWIGRPRRTPRGSPSLAGPEPA